MNTNVASILVIILACIAASLPFVNERFLALIPLRVAVKSLWMRLFELIIFYFLIGFIAFFLESVAGNRFPQRWEFFATTACLFLVLAFPGFVFRYLRKISSPLDNSNSAE
jgi:Na+(H+)/acetate symporter ActP